MNKLLVRLVIGMAISIAAFGQCPVGFVNVAQTQSNPLYAPDGMLWTGTMTYTLTYASTNAGVSFLGAQITVPINFGQINMCLAPGFYNESRTQTSSGFTTLALWTIPAGGGPYTILQNESEPFVPPTPVPANNVYAGPASGAASAPGFRPLVLNDLPGSGSITVNTSAPLAGGGPVALGGSLTLTCSSCGGGGTSSGIHWYSQAVSGGSGSENIVVAPATYGYTSNPPFVICSGIAECGAVNVASNGTVTVTALAPWTGTLYIATGLAYTASFASASSVSIAFPVHGLNTATLDACYGASGNQFGTNPLLLSSYDTGIGLSQGTSFSISFSVPQTGSCVLIGD